MKLLPRMPKRKQQAHACEDVPKKRAKNKRPSSSRKSRAPSKLPQTTVFPFVFGFKPPDPRHSRRAIGDPPLCPEYEPAETFFKPVPQPVSDLDWLANWRENGQSFLQFANTSRYCRNAKIADSTCEFNPAGLNIVERYPSGKVYLLPLGDLSLENGSQMKVEDLAEYTRIFYGIPVAILNSLKLDFINGNVVVTKTPKDAEENTQTVVLTTRFDAESNHYQVRVDSGLMEFKDLMPLDGHFMVIVTMLDLYGDASDLFVAGIGDQTRKMGIFSFFRYHPSLTFSEENWYEHSLNADQTKEDQLQLQLQRSCKLLVHEIGHLLCINHCIYYSCVMNGSGNLAEDFRQPHHLCPVDLRKVAAMCGLDVMRRYEQLAIFYQLHGMKEECDWVEARVTDINKRKQVIQIE